MARGQNEENDGYQSIFNEGFRRGLLRVNIVIVVEEGLNKRCV